MRVIRWECLEQGGERIEQPVALTIGVFDGLHIGHQKLIAAIRSGADGTVPLVLTFTSNPAAVLASFSAAGKPPPGRLLSLGQKLAKLERLGVGGVVLIDFSRDFSKLTGREFLEKLNRFFRIRKIVVGYNFLFGRNRDTDVPALKRYLADSGVQVEVIEPTLFQDEVVSSSRIRREITAGRLHQACRMLGEEYSLDVSELPVRKARDGWIEAPRSEITQVLPPVGEYGVIFRTDRGKVPAKLIVADRTIRWNASLAAEAKALVFAARAGKEQAEVRRMECR